MEPESMLLISFPWLFEKELGRIATDIDATYDLDDVGLISLLSENNASNSRERQARGEVDVEDYIQQEDGVIVHRGEELVLFRPDVELEDLSGDGHTFTSGESDEVILGTSSMEAESQLSARGQPSGDSGVEDVISRTELDGFIHPREVARLALGMEQGPLAGNLIGDDHETYDSPAESAISASSSFVDLRLSNSFLSAKASSAAN
jgi:RNA-dependent RNA polymerase